MAGPRTVDKSADANPGEHHYLTIGLSNHDKFRGV